MCTYVYRCKYTIACMCTHFRFECAALDFKHCSVVLAELAPFCSFSCSRLHSCHIRVWLTQDLIYVCAYEYE